MTGPLPDYEKPPVIEVVCGISFVPLERFQVVHVGMFWERLIRDFPKVEEHPPITTLIEHLGGPTSSVAAIQLVETPPLPRVWFVDNAGNGIIQIQRDAFLHNWRKLTATDQYPRFQMVMEAFTNHLDRFQAFIEEYSLGTIAPVQFELTYVNHLAQNKLWSHGKSVGALFPDFVWRNSNQRFLPNYEGVNWRTTFRLPEDAGRLNVSIQTAVRRHDNEPVVILELKARGITKERSLHALQKWFDIAHEWIVRGFADLTSEKAQKDLWGYRR